MVSHYTTAAVGVGPMRTATIGAMRVAARRREALAERGQRQRERSRNLWRAGLASGLLVVAVSTGFFAGANSGIVSSLFALSPRDALSIANVKRGELRTARVLFTLPDGETCRPMYFDNKTGEMSPGAGLVPCESRDANAAAHLTKFNWRGGAK